MKSWTCSSQAFLFVFLARDKSKDLQVCFLVTYIHTCTVTYMHTCTVTYMHTCTDTALQCQSFVPISFFRSTFGIYLCVYIHWEFTLNTYFECLLCIHTFKIYCVYIHLEFTLYTYSESLLCIHTWRVYFV